MKRVWVLFAINSLLCSGVLAGECSFSRLTVSPLAPDRQDIYAGRTERIEVRFRNEKTQGLVESFPEPPMVVSQIGQNRSCDIDGGVWARNGIFVNARGSTLIAHEFSGSNDHLVAYDTATCAVKGRIDVSNARWELEPERLRVWRINAGQAQRVESYVFSANCLPVRLHR